MEFAFCIEEAVGDKDVDVGVEDEVVAKGVDSGCGGDAAVGEVEPGAEGVAQGVDGGLEDGSCAEAARFAARVRRCSGRLRPHDSVGCCQKKRQHTTLMQLSSSSPLICSLVLCTGMVSFAEAPIDFNRDIRPILSQACFKCHGPDNDERKGGAKNSGGLRLDTEEGSRMMLEKLRAIDPGHPEKSAVIARISSPDADEVMPPPKSGQKLTSAQIAQLTAWIKSGAKYSKHWSYELPVRAELPKNSPHPVDAFVKQKLELAGRKSQPEADRETLIRRVSLDLTGLPPTIEEQDKFLNDKDPAAYERLVDRYLASPAYGEHWGRVWLDLARYADSAGYADDPSRTIWAYRDYVINAFNANLPFDQFTVEQIAGDLLPNPTDDQLVATAFHRNTMTNNEGGTNDEEFRNAAIVDRVNTTMAVWMGTSMACAQCHTHKYDPITHKEYFQMFAILNNTADKDRKDEAPLHKVYSSAQKEERTRLETEIKTMEETLKTPPPEPSPETDALRKKLEETRKQLSRIKPTTTVPIFKELPENERRITKIQLRGNYLAHGESVTEGVPAVFHPLSEGGGKNRLALARWLVDEKNPLTARVLANRYWEEIFGIGLVRTSEEFGSQGEPPSHPELLDWLATELVRTKWDLKKFLHLLVTSATYKQSSKVEPVEMERDPENRLLGRGPRFRLSAEMVRDQALAVSGLLSQKMHGPSVRPLRPNFGLKAAFGGGLDWKTSSGEDRLRRGLYTEWRRTSAYPSMTTFDAPNREICTLRRSRTNTPLQALVTLNDPVYVEAAQALARRLVSLKTSPEEQIRQAFRLVLARSPNERELQRLVQLRTASMDHFKADASKATQLATDPIGPAPLETDVSELAAWTTICSVILNLDETVMKR